MKKKVAPEEEASLIILSSEPPCFSGHIDLFSASDRIPDTHDSIAFSVFNNWGLKEKVKRKARITAVAIGNALNSTELSKGKPKGDGGTRSLYTEHTAEPSYCPVLSVRWPVCPIHGTGGLAVPASRTFISCFEEAPGELHWPCP